MGQDISIATLRSRVSALVEQESVLLTQAFELSRGGGDRRGVDALFAQVQAMQVERNSLRKQIGQVLGTQRLLEGGQPLRRHTVQVPAGASSVTYVASSGLILNDFAHSPCAVSKADLPWFCAAARAVFHELWASSPLAVRRKR